MIVKGGGYSMEGHWLDSAVEILASMFGILCAFTLWRLKYFSPTSFTLIIHQIACLWSIFAGCFSLSGLINLFSVGKAIWLRTCYFDMLQRINRWWRSYTSARYLVLPHLLRLLLLHFWFLPWFLQLPASYSVQFWHLNLHWVSAILSWFSSVKFFLSFSDTGFSTF